MNTPAVRSLLAMTGSFAVAIPSVAALGSPSAHAEAPTLGGHLTIVGESEVSNPWIPAAMGCDSYCFVRARTFFDSLATFGVDGEVHGVLAESIEPNAEYTEWTIVVRDGVFFTDGSPVDADAVIHNLQAGAAGLVVGGFLKDVAEIPDPERPGEQRLWIDKVDEMTLIIHTGADGDPERPLPWPDFPHLFTGQWGLIASPGWLEAVEGNPELATRPVGSGPFVVDGFEPRASLEVSRNPDYWMTDSSGNQLPYLDSIRFRIVEDPETSVEALEAGDVDVVTTSNGVAIANAQRLGDDFSVVVQDGHVDTLFLLIDHDKPGQLQDRRVRCAMSLAIDREEFNEVTTSGFSQAANGLFSPGQEGYLEDNGLALEQDLDGARAMIAAYESDVGGEVEITLGHTPTNAFDLAAELLIGWWSDVGIDVDELTVPQNDFISLALVGAPEFEVFIWREHSGVLLDQQYLWWHSENARPDGEPSLNLGRLRDPAIDAALETARSTDDPQVTIAAGEEINRIVARECYHIPLSWVPFAVLSDSDVDGLGELELPDGTGLLDPAGVNGQFWTHTLRVADE